MVKTTGVTQPTDKVRLGRFTECDQPHNSIVLNASNAKIDNIEHSGFYVTPIRQANCSNLLAYNSTTKEIIDVGGQKLKISSLEVENLDVVNSNTVHNYYVDNPIFDIARGNTHNLEDVGIVMHRSGGNVDIKFSEKDNHLSVNKDLAVGGVVKAKIFEGDAGLLSNVQFNFEVGDTFENLNVTKELRADGGLLSNISIQQLKDLEGATLNLGAAYVDGPIQSKKAIMSHTSVIAPVFKGDGSELEGVALKQDLQESLGRIEKIEKVLPTIKVLETNVCKVEKEIPKIQPLQERVTLIENNLTEIKPVDGRIEALEKYNTYVHEKIQKFQNVESEIKNIKPTIPDVSQITHDVSVMKNEIPKIPKLEEKFEKFEKVFPKIKSIETSIFSVNGELGKIPNLDQRLGKVETTTVRTEDFKSVKKIVDDLNMNIPRRINIAIKNASDHLSDLDKQILRFGPLESLVSNVHGTEGDILVIKEELPKLDERVKELEEYVPPPPTLQSVTSCESNTVCTVTLENPKLSLTTFGNVGLGTTDASSRLTIKSQPDITSVIGEVDAIKINDLAQINAYTKANNGLSTGKAGGLVFKTKRPKGILEPSMTIDGNGSVTIGGAVPNPSAILTLNSTTRGLLLPRMTTEQIENIKKPEPGLMVYDTEKDTFVGYRKTGWTELC